MEAMPNAECRMPERPMPFGAITAPGSARAAFSIHDSTFGIQHSALTRDPQ
jgi:hypothetical protein